MTTSKPEPMPTGVPPAPPEAWMFEDEIDLREYIEVLIKWRREIVLITLATAFVAALGVLAFRLLLPPKYEAVARVAIDRVTSAITFDERFRTLSEDLAQQAITDSNARRAALVGLASNGAVAEAVIQELGDLLTEEERDPSMLLEMVEAQIAPGTDSRTPSDLIEIKVTADSPEKAAAIANAWAKHYVEQVNSLYGRVPPVLLSSVQSELNDAKTEYQDAQKALETFLATSQLDRLNRLITEKKQLIDSLTAGTQTTTQAIIFKQELQDSLRRLDQAYMEKNRLELLRENALMLQEQAQNGGETAAQTNSLALLLLKVQLLGAADGSQGVTNQPPGGKLGLPMSLQLALGNTPGAQASSGQQVADLAALIAKLDSRIAGLDQEIEELSQGLLSGEEYRLLSQDLSEKGAVAQIIENLETEIQELQSQLAREEARKRQLTQQRDLAWSTFTTLSNKAAELELADTTINSEVRFAAPAIPPAEPVEGPSLIMTTALAGVVGFMLAIFIAFFANFMEQEPFLSRRREAAASG